MQNKVLVYRQLNMTMTFSHCVYMYFLGPNALSDQSVNRATKKTY